MNKTKAELALEQYLAGLTEKKVQCNDARILAGEAYNAMTGSKNGKNRVSHHANHGTPGYHFISIEEYEKLALNTPIIDIADK